MDIKVDEISKIIRQQIEGYEKETDLAEVGTIITVGDGIGRIYGLDRVMAGELLELPHDVMGLRWATRSMARARSKPRRR
jgi:F-type H+-transporting ATPase subunit alpha